MTERTFLGTYAAIMLASVPGWACALMCSTSFGSWTFVHFDTAFGAIFWIPASLLTFIALWILHDNCEYKPALLASAAGIVPFSILATLFLLEAIQPVLDQLFGGSGWVILSAFASLLLLVQGIYVAAAYVVSGGLQRDDVAFSK